MTLPESMSTVEQCTGARVVTSWSAEWDAHVPCVEVTFRMSKESPHSTTICLSTVAALDLIARLAEVLQRSELQK